MNQNNTAPNKGKGNRRPSRRRSKGQQGNVPAELRALVSANYGPMVKIGNPRERGGYNVRIPGEPRSVTAAMWIEADGLIRFDRTAPTVRKKELGAARRLEDKGFTHKAAEIRDRVAPEVLLDVQALRLMLLSCRTLGAVREVLAATGTRATWHYQVSRGDEYGQITLDVGKGTRLRAGTDGDDQPWYALDVANQPGAPTDQLAEILSAI